MDEPILNSHNKAEYEPAHTAEHILNQTMVRMFGCPRSRNAHIERKKSKCDYILDSCPSEEQVVDIEATVNEVILSGLSVSIEFMDREQAAAIVDLSKLPQKTLLLFALLGGALGAYLGMKTFRHKAQHKSSHFRSSFLQNTDTVPQRLMGYLPGLHLISPSRS